MTSLLDYPGRNLGRRVPGLKAALLALALCSTAACGDDASSSNVPDASQQDADPGPDAMRPIDASGPIDAAPRPDADPKAPDAGLRDCGGFAGDTCDPATEFCDFPDDQCGAADRPGVCVPRPELCNPMLEEVCGCDGRQHQNACEANKAGTDVAVGSVC
jgi:hypothetical protein